MFTKNRKVMINENKNSNKRVLIFFAKKYMYFILTFLVSLSFAQNIHCSSFSTSTNSMLSYISMCSFKCVVRLLVYQNVLNLSGNFRSQNGQIKRHLYAKLSMSLLRSKSWTFFVLIISPSSGKHFFLRTSSCLIPNFEQFLHRSALSFTGPIVDLL